MKNKGLMAALTAYFTWGFLPIFWRSLHGIPAIELLANRVVWSLLFLGGALLVRKRWEWVAVLRESPRRAALFGLTAVLLSINWLTYIWAVNAGYIIETSLGYFINPLFNVLLGTLFLGERLRNGQWAAVALATVGVLYLTISYGALPWIALTLAFSFGFYGLLRKTAVLEAMEGLTMEILFLLPAAVFYLIYLEMSGGSHFGHNGWTITLLILFSGLVTAVPLTLFSYGARKLPLTTMGLLQYIAPTIQLLIGVFVFGELFTGARVIGFGIIWLSLILYSAEGIFAARHRRQAMDIS